MAQTVIGIFDNTSEAQQAIDQLVSNGFSRSSIDMAARSGDYNSTSTGSTSTSSSDNDGFGESISKFFGNLFDSDDDRGRYSTVANRGCVVTVHTQSATESERAADLLDRYGAVDVNERASQYGYGSSAGASYGSTGVTDRVADNTTGAIPIIEENMQVGKRVVETGGVRLRSRIIERPVEEHVRLRVEHVHVERNPVNRPATEADLNSFREGTIEATEHAEVPVVGKTARVVEEVRLEKDVEERDETIRETLRGTDVDVENVRTDRTDTNRTSYDDDSNLNRPGAM